MGEVATGVRTKRVLIVDDSDDLRMMLRYRLARVEGLAIVGEAADGQAAIEVAATCQPDIILMDLAMPRMDGLTAAGHLRQSHPNARLIALTGYSRDTLEEQAREAGFHHYVVKGGSLGELIDLLEAFGDD